MLRSSPQRHKVVCGVKSICEGSCRFRCSPDDRIGNCPRLGTRCRSGIFKGVSGIPDSTLLVLTNIVGRGLRSKDQVLKDWYVPADQAIIVAGDVDAKAVAEKLRMLSYMVPSSCSRPRVE